MLAGAPQPSSIRAAHIICSEESLDEHCEDLSSLRRVVEWRSRLEDAGNIPSTPIYLHINVHQEELPNGSTLLGVVLSSDKTNISVISGDHMVHPLLISLANIDARIHSKSSLHAYLLLALLPIAKFTHKVTRVRGLLQDRLVHQAISIVLAPLKIAMTVGVMMSDPVGNLRYCFTLIASWIADTPEESLLAATGPKVSLITMATSKNFGDARQHELRMAEKTLAAI